MCDGIKYLMKEIPAIKLGWTGSDEVTLLFKSSDEYYSMKFSFLLNRCYARELFSFNGFE
jgi:tRNA(His) 5'-end guanylyltransferase